jgi:hypothetical protein
MAISNKMKGSMLALGALTIVALGGTSIASAHSGSSSDTLVDRLATKFNLNKDEVKAVFDEERQARQDEMNAEISKELQEAVDAGKITSEQKSLIENKYKELQSAREESKNAIEQWASDNNIEVKYLMLGSRPGNSENILQKAVDSGKITTEQKTLIESKQEEIKNSRESQRSELEEWAKDNGIDTQYIKLHGPRGQGDRGGMNR